MSGIRQRVIRAELSSDLSMGSHEHGHRDVDFVMAAGIASKRSKLGGSLIGLHATTSMTPLLAARGEVLKLVKRMDAFNRWRLRGQSMLQVAERALAHHISPVCTKCHGMKFELIKDTPVKGTKHCKHCRATGTEPLPHENRDAIAAVIAELAISDSFHDIAVRRLTRNDTPC